VIHLLLLSRVKGPVPGFKSMREGLSNYDVTPWKYPEEKRYRSHAVEAGIPPVDSYDEGRICFGRNVGDNTNE